MPYFRAAAWSTLLKIVSAVSVLVCLFVCAMAWRVAPAAGLASQVGKAVAVVPAVLLLGALLFVVQGYEIDATRLGIRRLLWTTTIPLSPIRRVWEEPNVLKGSIRIIGNGGLFSFSGVFWNRRLGRYRLFATAFRRAVVLVSGQRTIVLSPADPAAFLQHVRWLFPDAQAGEPSPNTGAPLSSGKP